MLDVAITIDNVWLNNGFEIHQTEEGQGVSIHNLDSLHEAIAHNIAHKAAPLNGKEFRFLRIELDLSQKALGDLMGKTDQMIAKWEKDDYDIPRLADAAIRNLYLESMGDKPIAGLLTRLADLDRQIHEAEIRFEETQKGWQTMACA